MSQAGPVQVIITRPVQFVGIDHYKEPIAEQDPTTGYLPRLGWYEGCAFPYQYDYSGTSKKWLDFYGLFKELTYWGKVPAIIGEHGVGHRDSTSAEDNLSRSYSERTSGDKRDVRTQKKGASDDSSEFGRARVINRGWYVWRVAKNQNLQTAHLFGSENDGRLLKMARWLRAVYYLDMDHQEIKFGPNQAGPMRMDQLYTSIDVSEDLPLKDDNDDEITFDDMWGTHAYNNPYARYKWDGVINSTNYVLDKADGDVYATDLQADFGDPGDYRWDLGSFLDASNRALFALLEAYSSTNTRGTRGSYRGIFVDPEA